MRGGDYDLIAYINCTNPLVEDQTIINLVNYFINNKDKYDSVNSAHYIKEFMFKENKPINYDLSHQPRSQDLPEILALNFAVNVITVKSMIEYKNVVGLKPYIYPIDEVEATDIDNQIDFDFAEYLYKKKHAL